MVAELLVCIVPPGSVIVMNTGTSSLAVAIHGVRALIWSRPVKPGARGLGRYSGVCPHSESVGIGNQDRARTLARANDSEDARSRSLRRCRSGLRGARPGLNREGNRLAGLLSGALCSGET
jgi:hypothetical protein